MRTTVNPSKGNKQLSPPPTLTLAVVTHYTNDAYHANRMEVVRLCIDSMLAGAQGADYELIIWDNGSTPKFRAMLNEYNPAVLVLSRNIGPHNARHAIGKLASGKLLGVTDDDIMFHPRWLAMQLEVLENYPQVGGVSGSPQRTAFTWATESNIRIARETAGMISRTGRLIPRRWEDDFCLSVGRNETAHAVATAQMLDTLLDYRGVRAWAHGHHMQILGRTDVLREHCFFTTDYLLDASGAHAGHQYNKRLDAAGYMNLTTYERTALHIGNVIDERIREIWRELK